jgi:hypothetical protein
MRAVRSLATKTEVAILCFAVMAFLLGMLVAPGSKECMVASAIGAAAPMGAEAARCVWIKYSLIKFCHDTQYPTI